MLYLVKGEIRKTEYYCDTVKYEEIRLVEAESNDEAESKFIKYFESKTCEYDVYYHVSSVYAYDLIK